MIWRVCSVYDKAAGVWMSPFCVRARGEAVRMFEQSTKPGGSSMMALYPEQFLLYEIGQFDDTTGTAACAPQDHVVLAPAEPVK